MPDSRSGKRIQDSNGYLKLSKDESMAKNEKIIAQDLAEIKHALQTSDTSRFYEMCEIVTREIKKYPVKPDIVSRIKKIIEHPNQPEISLGKKVEELNDLIEILISKR